MDFVFSQLMVFSNVIPDITNCGHSFVFSQSCVLVSASFPNISSLAVSSLVIRV